jgi:hypothetical protein
MLKNNYLNIYCTLTNINLLFLIISFFNNYIAKIISVIILINNYVIFILVVIILHNLNTYKLFIRKTIPNKYIQRKLYFDVILIIILILFYLLNKFSNNYNKIININIMLYIIYCLFNVIVLLCSLHHFNINNKQYNSKIDKHIDF